MVAMCRLSGSGHDNFIGIRAVDFPKRFSSRFLSLMDIGNILVVMLSNSYTMDTE